MKELTNSITILDVETSVDNALIGTNKASAFYPPNKIILLGQMDAINLHATVWKGRGLLFAKPEQARSDVFVGHAMAFDLHYLMRDWPEFKDKILPKRAIWDTQLAEFILSNQQHIYPSLDEVADKRGGTKKDDRIATMWNAGMRTEDIPEDMLADYLRGDIINTNTIFNSQIVEAKSRCMLPLIMSQMDALMATTEMTYNGIAIDTAKLEILYNTFSVNVIGLQKRLDDLCIAYKVPNYVSGSRRAISDLLFGCTYKVTTKVEDGTYKNGNPKFKKVVDTKTYQGLEFEPYPSWKQETGIYDTSREVLDELHKQPKGLGCPAIGLIIELREAEKILNTYISGIQKNIFPDGKIHPNINHCVAKTGRTTSTNPNLQNQPNHPFKKVFVPRNRENGLLIEADFGQIEVVALAYLSNDPQLIADLNAGRDIHSELYQDMYGKFPDAHERKAFKPLTFGLIYGAGATTLAKQGNVSVSLATIFIKTFYNRYPTVKKWHESLIEDAKANRVHMGGLKTKNGLPSGTYNRLQPTNRILEYHEYDNNYQYKKDPSFSPTELKNYPVQSFATADIVPLVLGKMYRKLKNHPVLWDKCLMIMAVHDSILFDLTEEAYLHDSVKLIKSVMEQAPEYLKGTFGLNLGLRLTTSIQIGKNWYEMKDYKED
jgi:DNA polymerase I-like protein with 3'-5' exonuclease and polymerase domains